MYPRNAWSGGSFPRTNRYNGGQPRPQRQPRQPRVASPKQVATIEKCLPGGEWAKKMDARTEAKIREMLAAGMTGEQASKWMDWLFAPAQRLPRANGGQAEQRSDTVTVTQEGFYLYENEAYKVQRTKDGQRMYALKATAKGWDHAKGIVYRLTPEMLMSAHDIARFGVKRGFCVNCAKGLDSPTSQHIGLGTQCGPEILGGEGYKAAKQYAIDTYPEVAEYEAMLKAQAKARREAKKAQAAAADAVILPFPNRG